MVTLLSMLSDLNEVRQKRQIQNILYSASNQGKEIFFFLKIWHKKGTIPIFPSRDVNRVVIPGEDGGTGLIFSNFHGF